jgi:cytochrome b6-f complex iron-sulfur subunit
MNDFMSRRSFLVRAWKWGAGLIALAGAWTSWDFLRPGPAEGFGGKVRTVPASEVPDSGVLEIRSARGYLTRVDGEVVALWWKCPHLGCKVPWCDSSAEFECPCHGSVFNRVGEYRAGPAPRGMDRFAIEEVEGVLVIDTGTITQGAPPGGESIDEPPIGPQCIDSGESG